MSTDPAADTSTTELPAGLITHDRLAGAALLGRHDEFRAMFKRHYGANATTGPEHAGPLATTYLAPPGLERSEGGEV